MRVQFIFRNSFSSVQFFDPCVDFRINRCAIRAQPFVMLMQYLERPVYHFVGTMVRARAYRFRNAMLLLWLDLNRHVAPLFHYCRNSPRRWRLAHLWRNRDQALAHTLAAPHKPWPKRCTHQSDGLALGAS